MEKHITTNLFFGFKLEETEERVFQGMDPKNWLKEKGRLYGFTDLDIIYGGSEEDGFSTFVAVKDSIMTVRGKEGIIIGLERPDNSNKLLKNFLEIMDLPTKMGVWIVSAIYKEDENNKKEEKEMSQEVHGLDGRKYEHEVLFEVREGRHIMVSRLRNKETGEVEKEVRDKIYCLFSRGEEENEKLINQEVSAIVLRDGKVPKRLVMGERNYREMFHRMCPRGRDLGPEEGMSSVVTTVGEVVVVMERGYEGRRYELEDRTVLEEAK